MTSFSFAVESTCLVVLGSLLVYTVALMRSGRLSGFISVRWIIAELAAICAVMVWGRLPVIAFTSSLGDRELMVVLAVIFFGLIAFLMLDSLQRISDQNNQLRRLNQELALLRESVGTRAAIPDRRSDSHDVTVPAPKKLGPGPLAITAMVMWIVGCIAVYVIQGAGHLPAAVSRLLTAAFRQ